MTRAWHRYEGPTWMLACTIYGGWAGVAFADGRLPVWIAVPALVCLTAWQSSLAHETIHAMRHVPRPLRTLLGSVPLGIWFPYELYRSEHLRHHATRDLTGPQDPESFYVEAECWAAMPAALRALHHANTTLAGRLLIGPAIGIARTYVRSSRRILAGDAKEAQLWCRHLLTTVIFLALMHRWAGIDGAFYLACVAYPATSLGMLRAFAEHRAADDPSDRTMTVESRGPLSLLFLCNNYHAAHHARPSLPWYELPAYDDARREAFTVNSPTKITGYRYVFRRWLFRPIDHPVRAASRPLDRRPAEAENAAVMTLRSRYDIRSRRRRRPDAWDR